MGIVDGYGPDGLPSALVLTFDNLGEASALERGTWSAGKALGNDPSVTEALPWLLDQLDLHRLQATFFVEAINCELYPDAVCEIATRRHELGHHGWSHEQWAELRADTERGALSRGLEAFEALGLRPRGFRPPGGELTERTPGLLRDNGFDWCSSAGHDPTVEDGLVYVPFDWELVDAYHLMERFAPLRTRRGDPAGPRRPADVVELMAHRLGAGGPHTLILHPFLMLDDTWSAAVGRLLATIAERARAGATWVVPGGVFADWLRTARTS
jgi:peptidoglycan/xylan/chitin deacetylase (PgdA/CDA1 family)